MHSYERCCNEVTLACYMHIRIESVVGSRIWGEVARFFLMGKLVVVDADGESVSILK